MLAFRIAECSLACAMRLHTIDAEADVCWDLRYQLNKATALSC